MWNHVNVVENQREWSSQTQTMSEFGTWWRGLCSVFTRKVTLGKGKGFNRGYGYGVRRESVRLRAWPGGGSFSARRERVVRVSSVIP
jgi:hypothetical protein